MLRVFFLLLVAFVFLDAKVTLQEIASKPPCRARNFLIWQYLHQNITSKQADKSYSYLYGTNTKVERLYRKKSKKKVTKLSYKQRCKKKHDILNIEDEKCFKYAINSYITLYMDDNEREQVVKRVKESWRLNLIKIQSEPYKATHYKRYDADTVLRMFLNSPKKFRDKHLDMHLDRRFINRLSKSYKFSEFVEMVLKDKKLVKLQHSLLSVSPRFIDTKTNFRLGLFHLQHNKVQKAKQHFRSALHSAKKDSIKDKNLFWLYQASKRKRYLTYLAKSPNINIYTLYAKEILHQKIHNYYVKATTLSTKKCPVNINDPFIWYKIQKKIKQTPRKKLWGLAKKYKYKDSLSVYSYILEKAYGYKQYGYIMPYDKYLQDISDDDKALVYALMRQESRFIPSALSRSFALGLMQLMPFLVDEIAQKSKEKVDYNAMFKPKKNLEYAIKHLQWMKKLYYHPLFIAYAYNGGVGFLRRHLKTGAFRKGRYEPFLSMELMQNSESREYGKKVLANYVMYKKILHQKVSIVTLLKNSLVPKLTDKYRK
jgi:soluble lytic murein transglycosylase